MKFNNKTLAGFTVIILLFILVQQDLRAQEGTHFGIRTGIYTDAEDMFIGGELNVQLSRFVYFNPNVEYIFVDGLTYFTFNFDAHYDFRTAGAVSAWAGGGIGLLYTNPEGPPGGDTNVGVNLLFGLGVPASGGLFPYVQGKAILSDNNEFVLGFGIRF